MTGDSTLLIFFQADANEEAEMIIRAIMQVTTIFITFWKKILIFQKLRMKLINPSTPRWLMT